ncbi:MAG TPA: WGxxGxxG family protein [Paenibacillus sp.]|uniref:WGxxGxxG family protein n=1 Tax=Paenibacillus sp. TaxID=58172 RepID=UPI002BE47754|nr:WGxxGxxG family protein [Paenibacillus sp.]HUC90455.1 WGxxGxxG family protein [Paenibacillus sp.]
MKRTITSILISAGLLLALSVPAYAENGTATSTRTGTVGPMGGGISPGAGTFNNGNGTMPGTYGTYAADNDRTFGVLDDDRNDNGVRRFNTNTADNNGNGNRNGRVRATAADTGGDNDVDWGWLGLLGLLGLAGMRNRNRQST